MGVGAGLYMYDVVVEKFTLAISSPDEFLLCCSWYCHNTRVLDDNPSQRETSWEDSDCSTTQLLPARSQQWPARPLRWRYDFLLVQRLERLQCSREDKATGRDNDHCVSSCCSTVQCVVNAGAFIATKCHNWLICCALCSDWLIAMFYLLHQCTC